jgi:hypothetical protein
MMSQVPFHSSTLSTPRRTLGVRAGAMLFVGVLAMGGAMLLTTVPNTPAFAKDEPTKMLRHVVLFKFKDDSSAADVQKVVDAFRGLKKAIPEVAAFEYGTNNSPEGLENGFTHCFLITFKSEKDREVYLPHPAHKAFVDVLKPHLDKVQVIDYWAAE